MQSFGYHKVLSSTEQADNTINLQLEYFRKETDTRVHIAGDELSKYFQERFSAIRLAVLLIDRIKQPL